jgi:peptidoglycan/xylan/chitin deacetylase (PgdA/CDA1 family)
MSDPVREHGGRPPGSLLSAGELSARRAAWRRRRARRRAGLLALLAVGLATLVVVLLARGGSNKQRRSTAAAPGFTGARSGHGHTGTARRRPRSEARSVTRVLGYTSYVQLAGHRARDVALTFDDGPSQYTPMILSILRRMRAPATFFVIGRSAIAYSRLVAEEARDGFEIGDHTETHAPLAVLSPTMQAAQIAEAADAIHRAGGPDPDVVRPPYGSFDQATLRILRRMRMLLVLWSADTKDYARPGVARIIYTAVSGAQPGAIILMHDGGGDRSQTVAALPRIITRLRQRGFRLVTISRLIAGDPPPANQPPPHPLSGGGSAGG